VYILRICGGLLTFVLTGGDYWEDCIFRLDELSGVGLVLSSLLGGLVVVEGYIGFPSRSVQVNDIGLRRCTHRSQADSFSSPFLMN